MRKLAALLLLLLLLPALLFSSQGYLNLSPSANSVNVTSPNSQEICTAGISGITSSDSDIEFIASLVSLGSSQRTFSITFEANARSRQSMQNVSLDEYSFTLDSLSQSQLVFIPSSVAQDYESIWWDASIVISNDSLSVSADLFESLQLEILSSQTSAYYTVPIYGSSDNVGLSALQGRFVVEEIPTLAKTDIRTVFGSGVRYEIAKYSFDTNAIETSSSDAETTCSISIYLSSSNDEDEDSPFIMRHINSNGTVSYKDTNHNSFGFIVYLTSSANGESKVLKFDGTGENESLEILASYYFANSERYTHWSDHGSISIAIPSFQIINGNEVTAYNLASGRYMANIFVHVTPNM